MTCPNYLIKDEKPFCRVRGFIDYSKEQDCLGNYSLCFAEARNSLEKRTTEEQEAIKREKINPRSLLRKCFGELHEQP